jgi:hypothetical protein
MSRDTDVSAFRHLMRVRLGVKGPKGQLLRCSKREGGGTYWKVKLDSGEWVWPDGIIIDGPGDRVGTCAECGLPFMSPSPVPPICGVCDEKLFGTQQRASEPAEYQGARARGPSRRR